MKKPVPSLSHKGWINSIPEKIDHLFAYYFVSEYSQSYIYYGHITSLPYHLKENNNKSRNLDKIIEDDLKKYFKRYFDEIEINVKMENYDDKKPGFNEIKVNLIVIEEGKQYYAAKEIKSINGVVEKIINA